MEHVNHNIFKYICNFLIECDLFALSCVNKRFFKLINRYFKIHNCNTLSNNSMRVANSCRKFDLPPTDCTQLLLVAVGNGKLNMCKYIYHISIKFNYKLDINMCDDIIFGIAAAKGYLDICKWLHNTSKKINIHANYEYAFRNAAKNGHIIVCKWLLQFKPDITALDNAAYKEALKNNHRDICELIESRKI